MSIDKNSTYSYSICHNVADGLGFFTLTNREGFCQTLEEAVALADKFNEVTNSRGYRATATQHYKHGGYHSGVVYKVIGVSQDGQPHDHYAYTEFPVLWITEAEYDAMTDIGEGNRYSFLDEHKAIYFAFTREKSLKNSQEWQAKRDAANKTENNA